MDFALPTEIEELRREALEVGRKAAAGRAIREDSWLVGNDPEFSRELAARNWIGMTWPVEYGGGGRSALERFVVYEALISVGAPVASSWFADRQIGPSLLQFGTDEQRRQFLPDIIAGTSMWSIGMSEPDAGSDVASIRTRAERDGDEFVVNGQKVWTSGGADADWMYLIARTDPEAKPHEGLSDLLVDLHSPGVVVEPIVDMTGNRHFCQVWFNDVRVPASNLVGELNGSFRQVMRQMEHERGGIDRLVSNRALYEDALASADTSDPNLRQAFARAETIYRIGRHLVLREVLGQAPKGWSALTKTLCTEFEIEVAELAGKVAGPHAMVWDRVARGLCYAPAYTIMGGTTSILRNILGERYLGLPREPRV
ncbi:MAG: acyl-CoA dehydrogenase family protein [Actinomycetota bacterium]|nr:acyl-CoA dehydrogenase family protein [Actinomycetota bacterium]